MRHFKSVLLVIFGGVIGAVYQYSFDAAKVQGERGGVQAVSRVTEHSCEIPIVSSSSKAVKFVQVCSHVE